MNRRYRYCFLIASISLAPVAGLQFKGWRTGIKLFSELGGNFCMVSLRQILGFDNAER
jgi:hypothetical protein